MTEESELAKFLSVGLVTTIHLMEHADPAHRFLTTVRGWKKGSFITVDLPVVSSRFLPIRKNMECVLRFFTEGRACGFDTVVISTNPSIENPYVQLAWPSVFKCVCVRRHERVATQIDGKITLPDGQEASCEIQDVSAGGCRVATEYSAEPGELLRLSFALPDATWLEKVKVYVRSRRVFDKRYTLGCEYAEDEKGAQTSSGFFVSSTLQRLRGSDGSNRRILVIEREQAVIDVLRSALETKGYEIIWASSVLDGFSRLRTLPPRALLLNYNQKELSPLDVCRLLRECPDFGKLPLIIYGGNDLDFEKKAQAAGATAYIRSEKILAELADALTRAGA